MKARPAHKVRSTHLELLGGVPTEALKRIREIAARADLAPQRVFRDILQIGLSVVGDPLEGPYQSLIAFRAGLAAKANEVAQHVEQDSLEKQTGGSPGEAPKRDLLLEIAPEPFPEPAQEAGADLGSDYPFERSGLRPEAGADSAEPA